MRVDEAYGALVQEIERAFPGERAGVLAQPIAQLAQALATNAAPTPTLDLLEDLLEALLRESGWSA